MDNCIQDIACDLPYLEPMARKFEVHKYPFHGIQWDFNVLLLELYERGL
jgi:hypothetical protein